MSMSADGIAAVIAAFGALVVAITGLVATLKGLRETKASLQTAAEDRAVASVKLDEVHASVVGEDVTDQVTPVLAGPNLAKKE